MKVLILSCSTGGGHNSCARYILEELTSNNIEATYQDFYDIVNTNAKELSSKINVAENELNQNKQDLEQEKKNTDSLEYIEKLAREKLGMYLQNERVYIDSNM